MAEINLPRDESSPTADGMGRADQRIPETSTTEAIKNEDNSTTQNESERPAQEARGESIHVRPSTPPPPGANVTDEGYRIPSPPRRVASPEQIEYRHSRRTTYRDESPYYDRSRARDYDRYAGADTRRDYYSSPSPLRRTEPRRVYERGRERDYYRSPSPAVRRERGRYYDRDYYSSPSPIRRSERRFYERERDYYRSRSPSVRVFERGRGYYRSPSPPVVERVYVREESRYDPPEDAEGRSLKFDVPLLSLASDSKDGKDGKVHKTSRPTAAPAIDESETVSIETSRRYTGDSGGETVVLSTGLKSSSSEPGHLRWIHLEHKHMSFETLQQLLLQTEELNSDDVLIALRLLRKFQEEKEKPFVHGYYLQPNVLRCDARDVGDEDKPDRTCTFVCFPYLSFQSAPPQRQKDGVHIHSARGLLQTLYYLESTKVRDLEQVVRKLRSPIGNEAIYVSQMWAIVLGSDTLITYSTVPLATMRGDKVQITQLITSIRTGPSTIRVTDPFERLFFLSLDQCKTWFELTNLIHEQCLRGYGYSVDECNLFLKNEEKLKAPSWSAAIEAEKSPIVDIFVRFKDTNELEDDMADRDRRRYRAEDYANDRRPRSPSRTRRAIRARDTMDSYAGERNQPRLSKRDEDDMNRTKPPPPTIKRKETADRNNMALIIRPRSPRDRPLLRRRERSLSPPTRQESIRISKEPAKRTRRVNTTDTFEREPMRETSELVRHVERDERYERDLGRDIVVRRRDTSPVIVSRQRPGPRYAAGGVVVNESKRSDQAKNKASDIYYVPETKKNEGVKGEDMESKPGIGPPKTSPRNAGGPSKGLEPPKSSVNRPQSKSLPRANLDIKPSVPPILMWPIGRTNTPSKPNDASTNGTTEPQKTNDSSIVDLLERVHDHLLTDQYYDHSRLFQATAEATRQDTVFKLLESKQPTNEEVPSQTSVNGSPSTKPETTASTETATAKSPKVERAKLDSTPKQQIPAEPDYLKTLKQFYEISGELLDAFLPPNYPSPVAGRYYGAMKNIVERVIKSHTHYFMREGKTSHRVHGSTGFMVQDVEADPDYLKYHNLKAPIIALSNCDKCKANHIYKLEIESMEHLRQVHFKSDNSSLDSVPSTTELAHWIKKVESISVERCAAEQLKVLKRCCQHLFELQMESREIRDGVSTDDKAHQARYRLPKALVESFQRLVILLIYVTYVLELIEKNSERWLSARWEAEDDTEYIKAYEHIMFLGTGSEINMSQGKLDLLQMIRLEDYTQSVSYEAVGPEYILAMVMNNLHDGINCGDLISVYKEWTERLAYQVSQRPRKRLLRDFQYLSEEISVLVSTLDEQWEVLSNFQSCLYPESFRVTTETRVSMYSIEKSLLEKIREANTKQTNDYEEVNRKVDRLVGQTKMSIEILDDDHGKAIFVFTLVTLIFLPLSFVASLLGMNTVDIRNQNTTQWLFWAIALPITAIVAGLALVVAYRYDEMREWIDEKTKRSPK